MTLFSALKAASRLETGRSEGARAPRMGWAHCPPLPEGGLGWGPECVLLKARGFQGDWGTHYQGAKPDLRCLVVHVLVP